MTKLTKGAVIVLGGTVVGLTGLLAINAVKAKIADHRFNNREKTYPQWYKVLTPSQRIEVLRDFCGMFYNTKDDSKWHAAVYYIPEASGCYCEDDVCNDNCLEAIDVMMFYNPDIITDVMLNGKDINELTYNDVRKLAECYLGEIS